MSRRVRIARTSLSDYTILSPGGREVPRVYAQLRQALTRELGPDHAGIFAEPVFDTDAGHVDWYGPAGTAYTLSELDPRARERAKEVLRARVDDIEALAGQMEASDTRDRQRLGAALRHALPVPDEASIRVIDGQPILTQWGMVASGREADLEVLKYFLKPVGVDRPPPPPPPPPPERWNWVPVALGLSLVATAGLTSWLLLRNCAIALPAAFGGGDPIVLISYCDQDARARTVLLDLINKLEDDLQNQRLRCPQVAVVPDDDADPEPDSNDDAPARPGAVPDGKNDVPARPDPAPDGDDAPTQPDPAPDGTDGDEQAKPDPATPVKQPVSITYREQRGQDTTRYGLCAYVYCQAGWRPIQQAGGGERPRCGSVPKIDIQISQRHEPGPGQCVYLFAPTTWPDVDWPAGARVQGQIDLIIKGKKVDAWPYSFTLPRQSMMARLRKAGRPFYAPVKTYNHPNLQGADPE